jgi:hypothetical protein
MRRILLAVLLLFSSSIAFALYRANFYQVVEIYVCDSNSIVAETTAKTAISRKELYSVSYCTCEGMDKEMKSEVTKTPCDPPRDFVFSCICVGKSRY